MGRLTELLLIRHGQSEGNVGLSTDPDCPLTDYGYEQARRVGELLSGHDLNGFIPLTSPYRRAWQTAAEIAKATGLQFEEEERVREWGAAATVGLKNYAQEPIAEVVERLKVFLESRKGQRLLIVSHAAPIALLTQLAWGEAPNVEGKFWLGVDNCRPRWLKSVDLS